MDGMTVFETVGRGSIPRRGTFNIRCPVGVTEAQLSSKQLDEVRFLDRTLAGVGLTILLKLNNDKSKMTNQK